MEALKNMPRYPAYKDSGEGWIGDVPEHWEIKKLKHLFYEKKHKQNMSLSCGSISFGKVVTKDDSKIPHSTKRSYQEVLSGEFLINPLNLNYDLISLRIGLSNIDVVVSAGYIVLKERVDISKDYFKYLLHRYDVAYMKLLGSGVRQTISFNHIANSLLLLPSAEEQQTIADFLDKKTGQIDEAIAIKAQQIELLKERKQIIIQNAVTRGLNPDAPLRDSGIDWIGEIPAHWEIPKLKLACKFVLDGTHGSFPRVEDGFRLLSVRNIINNKFVFRDDDSRVSYKHYKEISSKFKVSLGDIQLAIVGATLGKVAVVDQLDEDIVTQRSVATIRTDESKALNPFSAYFMQSECFQSYLWNNAGFSAQPGVYLNTIQNSYLPLPSIDEQLEIVSFIESKSGEIDSAITLEQQQIDRLKEYKTTLINSAVTGKIKVVD